MNSELYKNCSFFYKFSRHFIFFFHLLSVRDRNVPLKLGETIFATTAIKKYIVIFPLILSVKSYYKNKLMVINQQN